MASQRPARLPLNGIITEDGHYFHHTFAKALTKEEKQALLDNGIEYSRKCFTKEEDEKIRKNWERFAIEHNVDLKHAREASMVRIRAKHKDLFEHVDFTNFWPIMCDGLPNRSAFQVLWRMYYIYDPAIVSGLDKITYNSTIKSLMLTNEELEEVDNMRAHLVSWDVIAQQIGPSTNRCVRQHRAWVASNEQISRKLWMKLWKYADTSVEGDSEERLNELPVLKMIRTYCFSGNSEMLAKIIDSMDISAQADDLDKTQVAVRNTWILMLKKLRKTIKGEKSKPDALSDHHLFVRAVNDNIKFACLVSFEQLTDFLKILIQATPHDEFYSTFTKKLYNIPKIEARMKRRKITGFYCGNSSEFLYLYHTVYHILYRCECVIFDLFVRKYSVKERLSIFLATLELQWDDLFKDVDRNDSKKLDLTNFTERNYIFHKKYIYVKTSYLLDVLVAFTVRADPKWVPPTKLLSYMIRPATKALFSKQTDNSALLETKKSRKRAH